MNLQWEKKVYQIVLQAQEKRAAELNAFLDTACEGDEQTRKEVEKRLEGIKQVLENAKRFLE